MQDAQVTKSLTQVIFGGKSMSFYVFVPSLFGIIPPTVYAVDPIVLSRLHLEGSILLRWIIWHMMFAITKPSAWYSTFWFEQEYASCVIHYKI